MPKPTPKTDQEGSPAITFFILLVSSVLILAIGSLVVLDQNVWVQTQKYWIMSRSAAIGAYVVLTAIVLMGMVLSHPRNKDTWRLTPKLLPWHQALVGILFTLLVMHLMFTLIDSKSGVTARALIDPMISKYHPWATLFGVVGFYLLMAVGVTSGLRRWVKAWLPVHRVSWVVWAFVFLHGLYDGTDTHELMWLYEGSGALVVAVFVWRHWVINRRKAPPVRQSVAVKGDERSELSS